MVIKHDLLRLSFLLQPGLKKKVEQSLEDRIYNVLKKTRIVINYTKSALFSLPANDPYVHILSSKAAVTSSENLMQLFDLHCSTQRVTGMISYIITLFVLLFLSLLLLCSLLVIISYLYFSSLIH